MEKEKDYFRFDNTIDMQTRSEKGIFYTPEKLVDKTIESLKKVLKKKNKNIQDYVLWDSACGSGNLEYNLHNEFSDMPKVYLSSYLKEEVEVLKERYDSPNYTIFQLDFLNSLDTLFSKKFTNSLPTKLVQDLKSSKKAIFLINPPYANRLNKPTGLYESMLGLGTRDARNYRDLVIQFLLQIQNIIKEYDLDECYITMIYPYKYNKMQMYAEYMKEFYAQFTLEDMFIIDSKVFSDVKYSWEVAVGTYIYEKEKKGNTNIEIPLLDVYYQQIGTKQLTCDSFLNNNIKQPLKMRDYLLDKKTFKGEKDFVYEQKVKGYSKDKTREDLGHVKVLTYKGDEIIGYLHTSYQHARGYRDAAFAKRPYEKLHVTPIVTSKLLDMAGAFVYLIAIPHKKDAIPKELLIHTLDVPYNNAEIEYYEWCLNSLHLLPFVIRTHLTDEYFGEEDITNFFTTETLVFTKEYLDMLKTYDLKYFNGEFKPYIEIQNLKDWCIKTIEKYKDREDIPKNMGMSYFSKYVMTIQDKKEYLNLSKKVYSRLLVEFKKDKYKLF